MEKFTYTENRQKQRIERIELKLYELLNNVKYQCLQGSMDLEVDNIIYNSEKACKGTVFVCIKGALTDGHDYASAAVSKGAVAVICSQKLQLPEQVTVILVEDTRKTLALLSASFFDYPSKKLATIGVTGTKGKTTTTYMIKRILEEAGYKIGLIGTIAIDTGKRVISSENTTPESYLVQEYLAEMVEAGCDGAVIEVSSQALKYSRVDTINFDCGVFTNIEEDHIGAREHENFAEYSYWKSVLFRRCKMGIINGDDTRKDLILEGHTCQVKTFGFGKKCNLVGSNYNIVKIPGKLGVEFSIKGDYNINLVVAIPGKFTCYNAMAALAVCSNFDISKENVLNALRNLKVPGRQEIIPAGKDKLIMVDYAHNGTALRCLLEALREYQPRRLTCVFGCGGERDIQRRYKMGEAAAKLSDLMIVTSDNPRNESPTAIIDDIITEVKKYNSQCVIIPDRREAIDFAVSRCQSGEIVVVCGKGHETYQIIGDKKTRFDDREEVLASIEKVKNGQNYNKPN